MRRIHIGAAALASLLLSTGGIAATGSQQMQVYHGCQSQRLGCGQSQKTVPQPQSLQAPAKQQLTPPAQSVTPKPQAIQSPQPQQMPKPQAIQSPKPQQLPRPQQLVKPQEAPKPQQLVKPQEAPKPQQLVKPQEAPKPQQLVKPQEAPKPQQLVKPQEAPKPQQLVKPQEAPKPQTVEASKPQQLVPPAQAIQPKPQQIVSSTPQQMVRPQQVEKPQQQPVKPQQVTPPQELNRPQANVPPQNVSTPAEEPVIPPQPMELVDDIAPASGVFFDSALDEQASVRILSRIHHLNQMEILKSTLAMFKTQRRDVLRFAYMMVTDHRNADRLVTSLATKEKITLRNLDAKDPAEKAQIAQEKEEIQKLTRARGADFDNEYLAQMVAGHQKAVQQLNTYATATRSNEEKALISKLLPKIEEHLKAAQKLVGEER